MNRSSGIVSCFGIEKLVRGLSCGSQMLNSTMDVFNHRISPHNGHIFMPIFLLKGKGATITLWQLLHSEIMVRSNNMLWTPVSLSGQWYNTKQTAQTLSFPFKMLPSPCAKFCQKKRRLQLSIKVISSWVSHSLSMLFARAEVEEGITDGWWRRLLVRCFLFLARVAPGRKLRLVAVNSSLGLALPGLLQLATQRGPGLPPSPPQEPAVPPLGSHQSYTLLLLCREYFWNKC